MKLTLDRVEGTIAVFENETGVICEYPASYLPKDSSDGDVFDVRLLPWKGSVSFAADREATDRRSVHVSELFGKIKNKRYKDEN